MLFTQLHAFRVLYFDPTGAFRGSEYLETETVREAREALAAAEHEGRAELWCGPHRVRTVLCGRQAPGQ